MSNPSNQIYHNKSTPFLIEKIAKWHHDRNLIAGSTDQAQCVKLAEEFGELAANIARGNAIQDDIGDMLVVLLNIMERNSLSMEDCLKQSWGEIKDRKGVMMDGIFIKEENLGEN